MKAEMKLRKTQ